MSLLTVPSPLDVATNDNYHQQIDNYATEMLPNTPAPNLPPKNHYQTPTPQAPPQQAPTRPYQTEYRQTYDDYTYQYPKYDEYQSQYAYQQNYGANSQPKIGRIQDYDPLSDGPRAPPNVQHASATLIYNSTRDAKQRGMRGCKLFNVNSRHAIPNCEDLCSCRVVCGCRRSNYK